MIERSNLLKSQKLEISGVYLTTKEREWFAKSTTIVKQLCERVLDSHYRTLDNDSAGQVLEIYVHIRAIIHVIETVTAPEASKPVLWESTLSSVIHANIKTASATFKQNIILAQQENISEDCSYLTPFSQALAKYVERYCNMYGAVFPRYVAASSQVASIIHTMITGEIQRHVQISKNFMHSSYDKEKRLEIIVPEEVFKLPNNMHKLYQRLCDHSPAIDKRFIYDMENVILPYMYVFLNQQETAIKRWMNKCYHSGKWHTFSFGLFASITTSADQQPKQIDTSPVSHVAQALAKVLHYVKENLAGNIKKDYYGITKSSLDVIFVAYTEFVKQIMAEIVSLLMGTFQDLKDNSEEFLSNSLSQVAETHDILDKLRDLYHDIQPAHSANASSITTQGIMIRDNFKDVEYKIQLSEDAMVRQYVIELFKRHLQNSFLQIVSELTSTRDLILPAVAVENFISAMEESVNVFTDAQQGNRILLELFYYALDQVKNIVVPQLGQTMLQIDRLKAVRDIVLPNLMHFFFEKGLQSKLTVITQEVNILLKVMDLIHESTSELHKFIIRPDQHEEAMLKNYAFYICQHRAHANDKESVAAVQDMLSSFKHMVQQQTKIKESIDNEIAQLKTSYYGAIQEKEALVRETMEHTTEYKYLKRLRHVYNERMRIRKTISTMEANMQRGKQDDEPLYAIVEKQIDMLYKRRRTISIAATGEFDCFFISQQGVLSITDSHVSWRAISTPTDSLHILFKDMHTATRTKYVFDNAIQITQRDGSCSVLHGFVDLPILNECCIMLAARIPIHISTPEKQQSMIQFAEPCPFHASFGRIFKHAPQSTSVELKKKFNLNDSEVILETYECFEDASRTAGSLILFSNAICFDTPSVAHRLMLPFASIKKIQNIYDKQVQQNVYFAVIKIIDANGKSFCFSGFGIRHEEVFATLSNQKQTLQNL